MRWLLTLAGAALLGMSSAGAEEAGEEGLPLWELRGVAFAQSFPTYPASDEQNLTILPLPYPVYRGKFLRLGEDLDELAEGRFLRSDRINLSISIDATFPEDSDDIDARAGMPDLDLLAEIGPELEIRLGGGPVENGELKLTLPIRAAVAFDGLDASGQGFVFSPELEYEIERAFGSQNTVSFRFSPAWASDDYADYFYEVPPAFETADRPAFDASAGYLGTELKVGLKRQLSERWELITSARLWLYEGAQNDGSPLYRRDYGAGLRVALLYTFIKSKRRVEEKRADRHALNHQHPSR